MAYTCYYHPNLPVKMVCNRCGRRICASCTKPYGELVLCPGCYHTSVRHQPAPKITLPTGQTSYTQGGARPRGASYVPNTKSRSPHPFQRTITMLLSISATLIFFNAEALVWWPDFFEPWMSLFPWVTQLGSLSFILGIVLGLVIDIAVFVYMLGFRILSAVVVLPTAIVSLFIGGGFLFGLIIAVLTGIFIIKNEKTMELQLAIQ
ncbi:MAG TPA: hypothetical protein VK503_01740 [Candidatus Bathyarchaeia archaeon]|nr:hypothetical protein [Candidatus Bathyarchaeia archaeon]